MARNRDSLEPTSIPRPDLTPARSIRASLFFLSLTHYVCSHIQRIYKPGNNLYLILPPVEVKEVD